MTKMENPDTMSIQEWSDLVNRLNKELNEYKKLDDKWTKKEIEMGKKEGENLHNKLVLIPKLQAENKQLKEPMLSRALAYQAMGIESGSNPKGLESELQDIRERIVKLEMTLEGLLRLEEKKQALE